MFQTYYDVEIYNKEAPWQEMTVMSGILHTEMYFLLNAAKIKNDVNIQSLLSRKLPWYSAITSFPYAKKVPLRINLEKLTRMSTISFNNSWKLSWCVSSIWRKKLKTLYNEEKKKTSKAIICLVWDFSKTTSLTLAAFENWLYSQ